MIYLDDGDLASLLPTRSKTTSELVVGDLISDDHGVWVVAYLISVEKDNGCYEIQSGETVFVGHKPDQIWKIIDTRHLRSDIVDSVVGRKLKAAKEES